MTEHRPAHFWIDHLGLEPHPEGGYFKEVYRADETIPESALPQRYSGDRNFSTSIYYLLESDEFSRFHILQSDELWHFYTGETLTLHLLNDNSGYTQILLGANPEEQTQFQAVIPRNTCIGASINTAKGYALVGCTMAPGFEFEDFHLVPRAVLLEKFPAQQEIIKQLTIA